MKIGIIGSGSWGCALAKVVAENGHDVTVWSVHEEQSRMLATEHEHKTKLPGIRLPEGIVYTTDMQTACEGKELLVMASPSVHVRSVARQMKNDVNQGTIVVDVAKGIEENTLLPMGDILAEELPGARIAVLSGPSHAEEVGRAMPTAIVSAARSRSVAECVQSVFMNEYFRVYTSPDVLGVELGGSLKNVIALAAGMADGLKTGDNTKAALITRGIKEITELAVAMGAKEETVEGLSGMGDLIVTCASVHSRNRKAGMLMGEGYTMQEAMEEVHMVVEGVYSAKAAKKLGEKYRVELPIIEAVNRVLFEGQSVRDGMYELMQRDKKSEHTHLVWEE